MNITGNNPPMGEPARGRTLRKLAISGLMATLALVLLAYLRASI